MNIKDYKYELILILFFIIAAVIRINLDGLPLDNPGNIKAADPVYHTTITDIIKDTHQWKYYPEYIAMDTEKAINQQPPLVYTNAAMLSHLSSIPTWSTVYFIISILAALRIILIFLITQEIFNNKKISLLASALYVIPFKPEVWLYEVYIGFWIQVFALTLILAFAWIFIKYLKEKKNWQLLALSVITTGVMLAHPQDIIFLVIPNLYIIYHIIKQKVKNKDKIKNLARLGSIPGVCFILLLPWFLFTWKTSSYTLSWNPNPFPSDYLAGITTPSLSYMPLWLLILAIIGILISIISKYKIIVFLTAYYAFFIIILPRFLKSPHYLGRTGSLIPIFLAPLIALAVYFILSQLKTLTKIDINHLTTYIILSILVISVNYPQTSALSDSLKGEHIDDVKWEAYQWIKTNTKETDKFLFFIDCEQASCAYTGRSSAAISIQEFVAKIQSFLESGVFPTKYEFSWSIETYWDYPTKEISMFKFEKYDKEVLKNKYKDLTEFEYIYLRDLNQEIAAVNKKIITEGLAPLGYTIKYQENGIIILGK